MAGQFLDVISKCTDCTDPGELAKQIDLTAVTLPPPCEHPEPADWASVLTTKTKLLSHSKPLQISAMALYQVHTATRFGLSLGSAIIVAGTARRARVEGSKVVRDLTRGPAASALIDWYPSKFTRFDSHVRPHEALRIGAGIVIAPDPGLTLQLGLMPLRIAGLTVNYGFGITWQHTLQDEYEFGSAELTALSNPDDALSVSGRAIHMVGLAYKY